MFCSIHKKIAALFIVASFLLSFSPFQYVHGSAAVGATEATQLLNNGRLIVSTAMETISAGANSLMASLATSMNLKEFVLDPIAWAVAKLVISNITQGLIDWINSGFNGSPAFVTELDRFILSSLDTAVGEYLSGLDQFSFLCDPFTLDVQVAIAQNYQRRTVHRPQNECTATGIINNIQNFLGGNYGEGGLAGFFEVTRNPQNTPYGSFLEAEVAFSGMLSDIRDQEFSIANFGSGFLSQEICSDSDPNDCFITTPGKAIQEALTFQLSTGQESLIAADEINEIFAALLAQLLNTALGATGLFGLSEPSYQGSDVRFGNSPGSSIDQLCYTDENGTVICTDGSALDEAVDSNNDDLGASLDPEALQDIIDDWLAIQVRAGTAANNYILQYLTFPGDRTAAMNQGLQQANALAAKAADGTADLIEAQRLLDEALALPEGAERNAALADTSTFIASIIPGLATEVEVTGMEQLTDVLFSTAGDGGGVPPDDGTDDGTDGGTDDGTDGGTDDGTDDGTDGGTDDGTDGGT